MTYHQLGKTGLEVSRISLGTVELGMDYGIHRPGQCNRPDREDAIQLLRYAVDKGINLFDTAPTYGKSEELLGETIGSLPDCYIATKVTNHTGGDNPMTAKKLQQEVDSSLERSLRSLRRDVLDVVQIHNATIETLRQSDLTDVLLRARASGKVRFIGVSVYTEEAALAAIKLGFFDVIQVAYNLLDQRMARHFFSAAEVEGIGVICRSALLKGALTSRVKWISSELVALREASEKIINAFGVSWEKLPQMAIRFCLSSEFIHTVLIGAGNKQEIDTAVSASLEGPLDEERLKVAKGFNLDTENLLNPSYWSIA